MRILSHSCIKHFVHWMVWVVNVCWVKGVGFLFWWLWFIFSSLVLNEARTSLPYSSVYHIWAWICCFLPFITFFCAFMLQLQAVVFCWKIWQLLLDGWIWFGWTWAEGKCDEACHMIAKPSLFMSVSCIHLLLWKSVRVRYEKDF